MNMNNNMDYNVYINQNNKTPYLNINNNNVNIDSNNILNVNNYNENYDNGEEDNREGGAYVGN